MGIGNLLEDTINRDRSNRPESPEDIVRAALKRVRKGKKKPPSEAEKRLLARYFLKFYIFFYFIVIHFIF